MKKSKNAGGGGECDMTRWRCCGILDIGNAAGREGDRRSKGERIVSRSFAGRENESVGTRVNRLRKS